MCKDGSQVLSLFDIDVQGRQDVVGRRRGGGGGVADLLHVETEVVIKTESILRHRRSQPNHFLSPNRFQIESVRRET